MDDSNVSIKGGFGSKRISLKCDHQNGLLYSIPSEANWVCDEDSIYIHSLAGFFKELTEIQNADVTKLMQRWGLYYRTKKNESTKNLSKD